MEQDREDKDRAQAEVEVEEQAVESAAVRAPDGWVDR